MVFHGYHWSCGGYSKLLSGLEGKVGEIQEGCMGVWRSVPPSPINHHRDSSFSWAVPFIRLIYWAFVYNIKEGND